MFDNSWGDFREYTLQAPVSLDFIKIPLKDIFNDDPVSVKNAKLLETIPDILSILRNTDTVIAGGFVRYLISGGHEPEDIDIFSFNDIQFDRVCSSLSNFGYEEVRASYAAKTFKAKFTILGIPDVVQVIKPFKTAKTPRQLMDTFDFIICKCWMNANLEIFVHPNFDFFERKKVLKTEDNGVPLYTIQRMFKYHKRGYAVPIEDLVSTMDNFAKLSPADRNLAIERASVMGLY